MSNDTGLNTLFLPYRAAALQLLRQTSKDALLLMASFAPPLCAFVFRFGVPAAEKFLCGYFGRDTILSPYYPLFDLVFAILTPFLLCFIAAMVVLEDIDDKITAYMAVTPLGRKGYTISILGLPALISFFISTFFLSLLHLGTPGFLQIIGISMLASLQGLIIAMLIPCISGNKVEGMAASKFCSLLIIGIFGPFFIGSPAVYLLFPLPSYWMAVFYMENDWRCLLAGVLLGLFWILLLYRRFSEKLGRQ